MPYARAPGGGRAPAGGGRSSPRSGRWWPGMTDFRMPSLGADMDEGTLLEWLVGPGDACTPATSSPSSTPPSPRSRSRRFEAGVVEELLVEPGHGAGRDAAGDVRHRWGRAAPGSARRPRAPARPRRGARGTGGSGDGRGRAGAGGGGRRRWCGTAPPSWGWPWPTCRDRHPRPGHPRGRGARRGGPGRRRRPAAGPAARARHRDAPGAARGPGSRRTPGGWRRELGVDLRPRPARAAADTVRRRSRAAAPPGRPRPQPPQHRRGARRRRRPRRRRDRPADMRPGHRPADEPVQAGDPALLPGHDRRPGRRADVDARAQQGPDIATAWSRRRCCSRPSRWPPGGTRRSTALAGRRVPPGGQVHLGVAVSLRGGGLVAPALRDAQDLPLVDLMARLKTWSRGPAPARCAGRS